MSTHNSCESVFQEFHGQGISNQPQFAAPNTKPITTMTHRLAATVTPEERVLAQQQKMIKQQNRQRVEENKVFYERRRRLVVESRTKKSKKSRSNETEKLTSLNRYESVKSKNARLESKMSFLKGKAEDRGKTMSSVKAKLAEMLSSLLNKLNHIIVLMLDSNRTAEPNNELAGPEH
ncbi:unnamed protein product [Caenorhabditis nigoni]